MQPLFYRPNEFDDWGQIRNADGSMFASVRRPLSEEEAAEHRRNKTDPFEDLARSLIAGVAAQGQPAMEAWRQLTETQISAVMHLVESRLCIIWPKIGAREEFENALRVLEPAPDDEAEACEACGVAFKDGDMVYWRSDDSGYIHAECCGPERESYVNADGEPLKDGEPIPQPFAWRADRG